MSFVVSNQIPKSMQKTYAKAVKEFPNPPKIFHPVYSTPFASVKRESNLVKKTIEAHPGVVTYPKTPPPQDTLALVGALLRSPHIAVVPPEFVKTCLDAYPHLGIEAASNIFLPFHLRFYGIKGTSFYYKLLLLASSTDFTRDDVLSIFSSKYHHYDLGLVSDIVFNKPEVLQIFFDNEMFSIAASPNLSQDMVDSLIDSVNLRKTFHRTALAELAVNPWVSFDSRVRIISLLFKNKPSLHRSATRVIYSVPFVSTNVNVSSFPKFFKNFTDNALGLTSWASGSFSLQGFIDRRSIGLQVSKSNIYEAISSIDPSTPVSQRFNAFSNRFSSSLGVKVVHQYSPESLIFLNKVVHDENVSFLGKVASVLVFDSLYAELIKNGSVTKASFLTSGNNTYNRCNVLAAFIFFREFLADSSEWECFLSLAPSFSGKCFEFLDIIKKL